MSECCCCKKEFKSFETPNNFRNLAVCKRCFYILNNHNDKLMNSTSVEEVEREYDSILAEIDSTLYDDQERENIIRYFHNIKGYVMTPENQARAVAWKENERRAKEEAQRALEVAQNKELEILKQNDLYEYTTVSLYDENDGAFDANRINGVLRSYAEKGWRLRSTIVDEIGHDSHSGGYGGFSMGTNATRDQVILIFERCIQRRNRI